MYFNTIIGCIGEIYWIWLMFLGDNGVNRFVINWTFNNFILKIIFFQKEPFCTNSIKIHTCKPGPQTQNIFSWFFGCRGEGKWWNQIKCDTFYSVKSDFKILVPEFFSEFAWSWARIVWLCFNYRLYCTFPNNMYIQPQQKLGVFFCVFV